MRTERDSQYTEYEQSVHCYHLEYPIEHRLNRFLLQSKFLRKLTDKIQEHFSVNMTVDEIREKSIGEKSCFAIQLTADNQAQLQLAQTSLKSLASTITTKLFDDRSGNLIGLPSKINNVR
jgi:hypothetical protein